MEESLKQEHKGLMLCRVNLAVLIGFIISQLDCLCVYQSIYLEAILTAIAIVIFPYLTYLRKTFKWLFLVYGTVILLALNYIYINAKHSPLIPDFLMTRTLDKHGEDMEVLVNPELYKTPSQKSGAADDFFKGHKNGWEQTVWKFGITSVGEVFVIPDESVQEAFEDFINKEELAAASPEFKHGFSIGRKEAVNYLKSYAANLKKADQ